MLGARFTQATLGVLDWLAVKTLPPDDKPEHLRTGQRGEEDAYFYLRRRGYTLMSAIFVVPTIAVNSIWLARSGTYCASSK